MTVNTKILLAVASLALAAVNANARLGFTKAECDTYKQEGIDATLIPPKDPLYEPGMVFSYVVGNVNIFILFKDDKAVGMLYDDGSEAFTDEMYHTLLTENGVNPAELRQIADDEPDRYWTVGTDDQELADGKGNHILRSRAAVTHSFWILTREGHRVIWYLKNKAQ
jgi:hypothetical protein